MSFFVELVFANFVSHSPKHPIAKVSSIKVNGGVKGEMKSKLNSLQGINFAMNSWVLLFQVISAILADGILDCFLQ